MNKTEFQQRVKKGELLFSTMLSVSRNPRWISMLKDLPLDFITIDMEHSPYSWGEVSDLVSVAVAAKLPAVVRVPRPAWHYVTKVFDMGAYGVLIPYCETVEEVKEVVRAARWRPLKGRLVEEVMDKQSFPSSETRSYLQDNNVGHVVIIGIESVPAVENLEKILAVEGIDAVFIGPADLSISLGIPRQFEHPLFVQTVQQIVDTAHRFGVQVATNFQPLDQSSKWARQGISLIIHSQDYKILLDAYRDALTTLAAETGKPIGRCEEGELEI